MIINNKNGHSLKRDKDTFHPRLVSVAHIINSIFSVYLYYYRIFQERTSIQ